MLNKTSVHKLIEAKRPADLCERMAEAVVAGDLPTKADPQAA